MPPLRSDVIEDDLRAAIRAELQPPLADLQRFIDRRIAELSAELHASVEIADMTEAKLTSELARIHAQIAHVVAVPAASTRNSGVELEAVVQATEAAASTILEAAEAIQDWIGGGGRDSASIKALAGPVNAIFEACSFQDVTGQRVRRAIQHLQQVEGMLAQILPADTPTPAVERVEVRTAMHTVAVAADGPGDLAQAEIDALLNG